MTARFCTHCGTRGQDEAQRYCTRCGTPFGNDAGHHGPASTAAPSRRARLVVASVVALAVTAGGAAVALAAAGEPREPLPIPPPTMVAAPSPPVPAADAELARLAAQDESRVAALADSWVAQVSSKRIGPMADGRTYTSDDILRDHRSWRSRFPDSVLLRSERFASFRNPGLWVSVVATPFPRAEQANAWCDRAELSAEDCFAKRLATVAGVGRDTVTR